MVPTLKELRHTRNLTQEELATQLNMSITTLNKMERGHAVSRNSAMRVCRFFGIGLDQVEGVTLLKRKLR